MGNLLFAPERDTISIFQASLKKQSSALPARCAEMQDTHRELPPINIPALTPCARAPDLLHLLKVMATGSALALVDSLRTSALPLNASYAGGICSPNATIVPIATHLNCQSPPSSRLHLSKLSFQAKPPQDSSSWYSLGWDGTLLEEAELACICRARSQGR